MKIPRHPWLRAPGRAAARADGRVRRVDAAARHRLAAVPRHPRGGYRRTAPAPVTWDVGRNQAVRWKTPIPGLGHSSPVVWGDAVYVATSISGQKDAGIKVGYYGDIDPVKDDTAARMARLCARQEDRRRPLAEDRAHRRAEDQAAHEVDARELHARHRRRANHRVLRLRRPSCLRHDGQSALEEGPRRPRRRLLHGPGRAVGDRQFPGPARRRGRRPGRRAEGVVHRRVRREGRQGALAEDARRRADVEHADRPRGQRPHAAAGQRHAARRRVRFQDGRARSGSCPAAATSPCRRPWPATAWSTSPTRTA